MTVLALCLLASSAVQIPTVANPPDVHVLKYGWLRLNAAVGSAGPIKVEGVDDPAKDPDAAVLKGNQDHERPAEREKYEYKIRFKNTGTKTVTQILWAYVFADPASNKELVRHRFLSKMKIAPGSEKEQTEIVKDAGPPMLVSAATAKKNEKLWKESVTIEEVKYSDGSKWEVR